MDIVPHKKRKTLAEHVLEVELIAAELDGEDEITDEMMARFFGAKDDLTHKVDAWIYRLDAVKALEQAIRERRDRAQKALRSTEALQARMKEYLRHAMEAGSMTKLAGETGTVALQKNPESVRYIFDLPPKSFHRTVPDDILALEPSMGPYVTVVQVNLIDTDKVKEDLRAGMNLSFAKLERGSHVRIR